jgi:hypothetical protein
MCGGDLRTTSIMFAYANGLVDVSAVRATRL